MSTATTITAADINKLRQSTGAGMMDCRKALVESDGDFEKAIDYLRKKGQKVAALRSDREAKEGVIIAKTTKTIKRDLSSHWPVKRILFPRMPISLPLHKASWMWPLRIM